MKKVIGEPRTPWQGFNLDNPEGWASIHVTKNMQAFLSAEDHVSAIQNFFLECLDQVEILKESSPNLQCGFGKVLDTSPQGALSLPDAAGGAVLATLGK